MDEKEIIKNKGGQPRKEVDWDLLEGLCQIQCTRDEICKVLRMCSDTLVKRIKEKYGKTFEDYFEEYAADGKKSLRRKMFEIALKNGNVGMLIWLSKQYLGMSDKQEVIHGGSTGLTVIQAVAEMDKHLKAHPEILKRLESELDESPEIKAIEPPKSGTTIMND